jgi:diadenosine tetraphosphate (Ap4A) HIT family hydrolase
MEGEMTLENPEKPKPESAKAVELAARVRNAAALKYAKNLSDAEIAALFNVSVHTIPDWKKRKEWVETIKELSNRQLGDTFNEVRAMAPAAREVLFELLREGPPAIRLKIAQTICDWAIKTQL